MIRGKGCSDERDRPQAYAQAATEGASGARQVADRRHLLKNLREAVELAFGRHAAVSTAALEAIETSPEPACDSAATGAGATASAAESSSPQLSGEPRPEATARWRRVNRLKTVKRLMYGRAGFVLLRARALHAA